MSVPCLCEPGVAITKVEMATRAAAGNTTRRNFFEYNINQIKRVPRVIMYSSASFRSQSASTLFLYAQLRTHPRLTPDSVLRRNPDPLSSTCFEYVD